MSDIAESTVPGAVIPKNQKGCHTPGKTLPLVGAPGFTANGMNFQLIKFMLKRIYRPLDRSGLRSHAGFFCISKPNYPP